jgi:hypothetical protein
MAYNPTINSTDRIKNTRPQLQENFNDILNWTAVDHATFGTPNEGMHNQVTMPIFTPGAPPAAGSIRLWSDTDAATGQPELYFYNGTSGDTFPMTASNMSQNGYTFLPGGFLLKWFSIARNDNMGGPFTFIYPAVGNSVPFSVTYAAYAIVNANNNPNADVNAVAYVSNITNPAQIVYRVWQRNATGSAGTPNFPYTVNLIVLGIP